MRGPLEALSDMWDSGDVRNKTMVEWIEELRKRLQAVREIVTEKEGIAKKKYYDRKAVVRNFEEGSLVWLELRI